MNNASAVALKTVLDRLCKTFDLLVGESHVDETLIVRLQGIVVKGADEEYVPTTSIPYKKVMEMFLARMGFQRERAMDILVQSMTDAVNGVSPADVGLQNYIKVDEVEKIVQNGLDAMPTKSRKGKTKVECSVAVTNQKSQTVNI